MADSEDKKKPKKQSPPPEPKSQAQKDLEDERARIERKQIRHHDEYGRAQRIDLSYNRDARGYAEVVANTVDEAGANVPLKHQVCGRSGRWVDVLPDENGDCAFNIRNITGLGEQFRIRAAGTSLDKKFFVKGSEWVPLPTGHVLVSAAVTAVLSVLTVISFVGVTIWFPFAVLNWVDAQMQGDTTGMNLWITLIPLILTLLTSTAAAVTSLLAIPPLRRQGFDSIGEFFEFLTEERQRMQQVRASKAGVKSMTPPPAEVEKVEEKKGLMKWLVTFESIEFIQNMFRFFR